MSANMNALVNVLTHIAPFSLVMLLENTLRCFLFMHLYKHFSTWFQFWMNDSSSGDWTSGQQPTLLRDLQLPHIQFMCWHLYICTLYIHLQTSFLSCYHHQPSSDIILKRFPPFFCFRWPYWRAWRCQRKSNSENSSPFPWGCLGYQPTMSFLASRYSQVEGLQKYLMGFLSVPSVLKVPLVWDSPWHHYWDDWDDAVILDSHNSSRIQTIITSSSYQPALMQSLQKQRINKSLNFPQT